MTRQELEQQAAELAASTIMVETNDGTFGAQEAIAKTRVGEPRYNVYRIFARVGDGHLSHEGPSPDKAPGYPRRYNGEELARRRSELKSLRAQIAAMA